MKSDEDKIFPDHFFQTERCPVCGNPSNDDFDPYCSKDCMTKDPSNQWLHDNSMNLPDDEEDIPSVNWPSTGHDYLHLSDEIDEDSENEKTDLFKDILTDPTILRQR
jgi:Domain of unknown function (DUF329).